jgi:release factor glutamine methyltransferase
MTVAKLYEKGSQMLATLGIHSAKLDMRLIIMHILNYSHLEFFLNKNYELLKEEEYLIINLLRRRLCFEPLAYLLGKKEFYGHEFIVSKACLIPRPDTECVVQECLKLLASMKEPVVYDIASGSGAIGLSLLKEKSDIKLMLSDICRDALAILATNAQNLGLKEQVIIKEGDLLEPFLDAPLAHLIVSNPPYISPKSFALLSPDVKDYEPSLALRAPDEHGIAFYERLIKQAHRYIHDKGYLVVEIAFDQSELVTSLAHEYWTNIIIRHDLAGRPRVVIMQKKD